MNGIYAQISCSMTRDPRMIAAGWQARAVYVEAVLYCRENLTDGIIDRLALPYWMPDMPVKARSKLLDRLIEVGALTTCEQGWSFPEGVWSRWNPSRADVEAKREAEKQRKANYRAKRREETDVSEDVPMGQVDYATSRDKQPETEPEPETKKESSPRLSTDPTADEQPVDNRFDLIVKRVVFNREQRQHQPPRNPTAWRTKVRTSVVQEHTERIHTLMDSYPDAPHDVLAAAVDGETRSLGYYETRGTGS
jgi:hypothetical protein